MSEPMRDIDPEAGTRKNASTRDCLSCSQPFEPTRWWQVYCCPRCRFEAANQRRRYGVADRRLVEFFAVVSKRMAKGALEYGERSWSADPGRLAEEILQELADVSGWSAILFSRVSSILKAARRLGEDTKRAECLLPDAEGGNQPWPPTTNL